MTGAIWPRDGAKERWGPRGDGRHRAEKPDGRSLNRELVRAGFAWWYRRYAPDDETLEQLEREARGAKRGLWVDPDAVPPWEWRRVYCIMSW